MAGGREGCRRGLRRAVCDAGAGAAVLAAGGEVSACLRRALIGRARIGGGGRAASVGWARCFRGAGFFGVRALLLSRGACVGRQIMKERPQCSRRRRSGQR